MSTDEDSESAAGEVSSNGVSGEAHSFVQVQKLFGDVRFNDNISGDSIQKLDDIYREVCVRGNVAVVGYERCIESYMAHISTLAERLRWTEDQLAKAMVTLANMISDRFSRSAGLSGGSTECACVQELDLRRRWSVLSWFESSVIEWNGDEVQDGSFGFVSEIDGLAGFNFWLGCGWEQPESIRERVVVDLLEVVVGGRSCFGKTWSIVWVDLGTMVIDVQFDKPVGRGVEFQLDVRVSWPGKSRPLVASGVDHYWVRMDRPARTVRRDITLPIGINVDYAPIGFDPAVSKNVSVCVDTIAGGRSKISLEGYGVDGRVGFDLIVRSGLVLTVSA